jgi:hypothetical protein
MSDTFEKALQAVARISHQPKFKTGQPVWVKDHHFQSCYIIIGLSRSMFEGWFYEVVHENDPTGPTYMATEDRLTDQAPASPILHPDKKGTIHFTDTGRPLKAIRGGFTDEELHG